MELPGGGCKLNGTTDRPTNDDKNKPSHVAVIAPFLLFCVGVVEGLQRLSHGAVDGLLIDK